MMSKRMLTGIVGALLCLLLLAGAALAMSSPNYRLDWFTPLTAGAGGPAGSPGYAVDVTVGQSAIGTLASASYQICLGYWCGASVQYDLYLPLLLRGFRSP
jgi:apolipoprotein N-acyltransferase